MRSKSDKLRLQSQGDPKYRLKSVPICEDLFLVFSSSLVFGGENPSIWAKLYRIAANTFFWSSPEFDGETLGKNFLKLRRKPFFCSSHDLSFAHTMQALRGNVAWRSYVGVARGGGRGARPPPIANASIDDFTWTSDREDLFFCFFLVFTKFSGQIQLFSQ